MLIPCSRSARPYLQKEVKVKAQAQVEQRSIRPPVFSTLAMTFGGMRAVGDHLALPVWPVSLLPHVAHISRQ